MQDQNGIDNELPQDENGSDPSTHSNEGSNMGDAAMIEAASGSNGVAHVNGHGANAGDVRIISIEDEMRASYLEYAMSVIVARAARRPRRLKAGASSHSLCHARYGVAAQYVI